jgi:hypothetical protein
VTSASLVAAAPARRPWLRTAAWASGGAAVGCAGLAVWQGLAARDATRRADAMLLPDGTFKGGVRPEEHDSALASAARSRRWSNGGLAGAAAFAAAAGALGWLSYDQATGQPAVRF